MYSDGDHYELKKMLEKNTRLLEDNNKILHKLYRNALIGFWLRILWYVVLIGLPFALYFYILEPYFELLGSSYQEFSEGMAEIPGWKQFTLLIDSMRGGADGASEIQRDGFTPVQ